MNSNKKNIDDLFRDRLMNEQANFNPAHWEKMAGLLDKQFVPPGISSGAATTISSAVKLIIISVSVSVPALLYVIFGTDLLDKKSVITENPIKLTSVTNVSNSTTYNIDSDTISYNDALKSGAIADETPRNNENKIPAVSDYSKKVSETRKKIIVKQKNREKIITSGNDIINNENINDKANILEDSKIINIQENKQTIKNLQLSDNLTAVTEKQKEIITKAEEIKNPVKISKVDSISSPDLENSYFPLQKYRGIYAYLGANYGKSFSNINDKSDYFSPVFGIGFEKYLKKDKYALMIELLYLKSLNHSFEKTSISKSYFLDEETTIRILNTYELEYLRIPLLFKYKLNKHQFLTGIYASYLLNSKSILTESIISQSINLNSSTVVSAYRDGFNDFSYGFILGYHYSLTKMFDIGFRFNFSPADLSKDAYYLHSEKDNMTEFQFNILWKLY